MLKDPQSLFCPHPDLDEELFSRFLKGLSSSLKKPAQGDVEWDPLQTPNTAIDDAANGANPHSITLSTLLHAMMP